MQRSRLSPHHLAFKHREQWGQELCSPQGGILPRETITIISYTTPQAFQDISQMDKRLEALPLGMKTY